MTGLADMIKDLNSNFALGAKSIDIKNWISNEASRDWRGRGDSKGLCEILLQYYPRANERIVISQTTVDDKFPMKMELFKLISKGRALQVIITREPSGMADVYVEETWVADSGVDMRQPS